MANRLISNFSGGMNNKVSPLIIKDTESELVLNYNLDTVGALTKRNGYDVYGSQPVAGKRVVGLFQYTNTSTSAETTQIMVANAAADANTIVYYNNAATWTTSLSDTAITTYTNFNRYRFATFLDKVMRVNGTAAVAGSVNVDGSTWTTSATPDTGLPATITPSFIAVFQDRVYLARGGTGDGSRVYFSSLPTTGATPAITWAPTTDYFDINPDDGDQITGLENNGNRLLMFKSKALYRWTWGQTEPDRLIGVGTDSQECVKTNFDLGITFFANKYGAYAYTGARPKLISRKIQKWFDAIPVADLDDVCAEVDGDHYYLYLSDSMTVDDRVYANVMAVYTISLDAWVIYTLNTNVRFMNKLTISSIENIYFGNSQGRTYLWNSGTADDSGGASYDTATSINAEVITKEYLLSFPEYSTLQNVDIITLQGGNTKASHQLDRNRLGIDRGDFIPLIGNFDKRVNTFKVGNEARTVRLRIMDSSQSVSVIEGFNFETEPKKKR